MTLNFTDFRLLTFDCYGTLIDWEGGILPVLKSLLTKHQIILSDQIILENFAEAESWAEAGDYINYRQILEKVVIFLAEKYHFSPSNAELNCLADSIQYWLPFSDTVE
ncbi:MAG: haloacid dehalogenase, partial [Microcoleaceae cyanobacterium]